MKLVTAILTALVGGMLALANGPMVPLSTFPRRMRRWLLAMGQVKIPAMAGGSPSTALFPLGRHVYMEQYIDPDLYDDATVNGVGLNLQAAPYHNLDHFSFVVGLGDADIVADFKLQSSPDDSVWTDITGAVLTQITATDDNKFALLEISKEGLTVKFLRGVLVVGDGAAGNDMHVFLIGTGWHGEFPTTAAADRLEHVVVAV